MPTFSPYIAETRHRSYIVILMEKNPPVTTLNVQWSHKSYLTHPREKKSEGQQAQD
ncbi:predicted protein [Botrytis cinerea T4]|uniref:Uncharacterized protein n=1 Tax=Botryotinia fuckeliana (strain T4) TaxID=999810 RepID=G2Y3G0_BOTF4|nr:predicted protein [Botrytis cinerea T4]